MSTCISRHGEYSEHEPGDWCPRCGAFNEEGIVAERDALVEKVERVRGRLAARLEFAWDDGNAMGLDGWVGPDRGTEPDEEAIRRREKIVDRLWEELMTRTALDGTEEVSGDE